MNKMATTQDIILELLSDNNLHSIKEIKAKIYEIDSSLLENDNFIYVVLNYLKNKKGLIESGKKGFSSEILCKIARKFTVSCDYIMYGEEQSLKISEKMYCILKQVETKQIIKIQSILKLLIEICDAI